MLTYAVIGLALVMLWMGFLVLDNRQTIFYQDMKIEALAAAFDFLAMETGVLEDSDDSDE